MGRQLLRFTFPPVIITEPIIYQLGKEFEVATNIRRANVTKDKGWVILELQGDDEEISRAVRWAEGRGVLIEPVSGELNDW